MVRRDKVGDRVHNARAVIGSQFSKGDYPVKEGKHFTVLAYTDWCDEFVPTVVAWKMKDGTTIPDDFSNLDQSKKNAEMTLA